MCSPPWAVGIDFLWSFFQLKKGQEIEVQEHETWNPIPGIEGRLTGERAQAPVWASVCFEDQMPFVFFLAG
jgi:hypothetical protein